MTLPGWLVVAPIRVVIAVVRLRCHVISLFTLSLTHLSIAVLASRCKLLPIVQIIIHMNCFFKPCDWRLIEDELKIVVQARAVHHLGHERIIVVN